jgi:hypothetical protein
VKQYSAERKEALLRQNRLVSELARESGITEQTLILGAVNFVIKERRCQVVGKMLRNGPQMTSLP